MKISEIVVGDKVYIHSYRATDRKYGTNEDMEKAVGKFKVVDGIEYDAVRVMGYTWSPEDFAIDVTNPIIDVPASGEKVMFNPEAL